MDESEMEIHGHSYIKTKLKLLFQREKPYFYYFGDTNIVIIEFRADLPP